MKTNKLSLFIFYISGLLLLSLGICLVILANLGAGAWDALNVGLSEKIGLTPGSWLFIVGCILILINALLLSKIPDFLSVITVFILGFLLDFWMYLIHFTHPTITLRATSLASGIILSALGIAIYTQSRFAITPVDRLMFVIAYRTGWSLRASRTLGEVIALVLAWLFSGPINIGTLLITFLLGPLIQFFNRVLLFTKK